MDESRPVQNRRFRRSNVLLKATLELPGESLPVILRNLSQDGVLVQGEDLPEEGARVLFHRQGLSVPGQVVWSHRNYAGLEFDFPLFPREMLRHVPAREPKALPPPPPLKRRPGLGAMRLTLAERMMIERWATEAANKLGE